jgi:Tol biopolymer transport system component
MNPDGSGIQQLTDGVAIEDDPAFSPDGKRLAYLDGRTADPPVWQLWTMNADGSGARRLTKIPVEYERPSWSPDGTRIAFTASTAATWPSSSSTPTGVASSASPAAQPTTINRHGRLTVEGSRSAATAPAHPACS